MWNAWVAGPECRVEVQEVSMWATDPVSFSCRDVLDAELDAVVVSGNLDSASRGCMILLMEIIE
jgi:hypothetical protein